MSLGMMNAILGRFVERGWIMLTNVNGRKLALRTFKLANVYSEAFCKKLMEAIVAGKTKVVLYGEIYIKFIIKYACNEVGMNFEQKDASDKVLSDAVCIAGELNAEDVQKVLIKAGCFSLVNMVQDIK